jgi:hypothetical protein
MITPLAGETIQSSNVLQRAEGSAAKPARQRDVSTSVPHNSRRHDAERMLFLLDCMASHIEGGPIWHGLTGAHPSAARRTSS